MSMTGNNGGGPSSFYSTYQLSTGKTNKYKQQQQRKQPAKANQASK